MTPVITARHRTRRHPTHAWCPACGAQWSWTAVRAAELARVGWASTLTPTQALRRWGVDHPCQPPLPLAIMGAMSYDDPQEDPDIEDPAPTEDDPGPDEDRQIPDVERPAPEPAPDPA